MNDLSHPDTVAQIIGTQLRNIDFDLIDVIPVANDDNADKDELQQYLVQVRPRRAAPPPAPAAARTTEATKEQEGVYQADGSLNVPYLFKNAELLSSCGDQTLAKNIYFKIAQGSQSATHTGRALLGLGKCYESENQLEEARARYEQSITFQPAIETYQRLANLLLHQKKDRPAAEAFERALNLKDISDEIRFELLKSAGNSWMRAGEMASAERAYKKALETEPTADEIQANLGALYLQAGKIPDARRKFQDTLATNARNARAIAGLGMCLLQEGMKREAHDTFARSLDVDLNNAQAIYHLVKCAYELKTYATAARIVENYIQVAPININLLYSLAGLQFHLGRMNDASGTVHQILEMNPTHNGAKELLRRIESFSCHGGQDHNGN